MKAGLLEILVCPRCRSDLQLHETELECTGCQARSPIIAGVPQLLVEDGLVAKTRSNFDYQWSRRLQGAAERRTTVYGYDIEKFMRWFDDTFVAGTIPEGRPAWAIDVGCGSAEKARELALRYPHAQVVAIDQIDAVRLVAQENSHIPNLHFVQANVWHLPFKHEHFVFAMSIGVLHHTPDTYRAFSAIAPLLVAHGRLVTWIYPLAEEDSFWSGLYTQRDKHFLRLGHRLPKPFVMWWCRWYTTIGFRKIVDFLMSEYHRNRERMPIYPDTRPTRRELFESFVFLTFDNVSPCHQYRHGSTEVCSWYQTFGFGDLNNRFPGFFSGTKLYPTS